MFHQIQTQRIKTESNSQLTPENFDALSLWQQNRILRQDIAEMWRAHNHNAQVIATLTQDNERLKEVITMLQSQTKANQKL